MNAIVSSMTHNFSCYKKQDRESAGSCDAESRDSSHEPSRKYPSGNEMASAGKYVEIQESFDDAGSLPVNAAYLLRMSQKSRINTFWFLNLIQSSMAGVLMCLPLASFALSSLALRLRLVDELMDMGEPDRDGAETPLT